MAADTDEGLDPDIVAALDEVLTPDVWDPVFLSRVRRLIRNCLTDNYDTSDVLAIIELAVRKSDAETENLDGP